LIKYYGLPILRVFYKNSGNTFFVDIDTEDPPTPNTPVAVILEDIERPSANVIFDIETVFPPGS